jgi:DNA-directed RNA polymerase specialized sigma24 family protein
MAKKHYVNNKDFIEILVEYHNAPNSRPGQKAYQKIGKIFLILADRIANGGSFRGYSSEIKEEMVNDAVFTMIRKLDKYDHEKYDNPFSYFTSVTINVFRQHMNKLHLRMERNVRFDMIHENGLEYIVLGNKFDDKFARGEVDYHNSSWNNGGY